MLFIILRTLLDGVDVPGYASLVVLLLFFSGMNMIGLGIIGEYLGRVFLEVKRRPIYLVSDRWASSPRARRRSIRRRRCRRRWSMPAVDGGTAPLLRHLLQYLRFGAVGLAATAVHALAFVALIELAASPPLLANLAAFALAVLGLVRRPRHWTFRSAAGGRPARRAALARFILVALLGLGLNSLAVYLIADRLELSYWYALAVMVTAVPLIIFVISKRWVFAGGTADELRCDPAY